MSFSLCFRNASARGTFQLLLQDLAGEASASGYAYLRGDVIGPRGPAFDGYEFEAFYVSMPVCVPDSFHTFVDASQRAIVFAWLIPITHREAEFVELHGWRKFEDLLDQSNIDLLDLERPSVA